MLRQSDYDMAPCLRDSDLAEEAGRFILAARALGSQPSAMMFRALFVPMVFNRMEQIFAGNEEPTSGLNHVFRQLVSFCDSATNSGFVPAIGVKVIDVEEYAYLDTLAITSQHYGNLFRAFSDHSYWDEPLALLRTRLERNGIELPYLADSTVLDAGCGGGRYTVAWKLLGAKASVGIDSSLIGIDDARKRVEHAGIRDVEFQTGSVLRLPFGDASFEIVYCNGVLHHTTDWREGIGQIMRVLKPGGLGWLYLIENPGGLFWDVIEVLRVLLQGDNHAFARKTLQLVGIPANRVFYMLDHVMVPINLRLTRNEIEEALHHCGARNIRRLVRGADFDRVEQVCREVPYASIKYGIGEHRYVFSK